MEIVPKLPPETKKPAVVFYCPAIICRRCGTPLESPDELGMG
jgi:hypothetical protein